MKIRGFFAILATFVLLTMGSVSAMTVCSTNATTVGGTIYTGDDLGNIVSGANVTVTCHDSVNGDIIRETTSNSNGNYKVVFNKGANYCAYGSDVTVEAVKNSLNGEADGQVLKHFSVGCIDINVGIVNVPLIPEFGFMIGTLTVLGALVVFFVIRKR